MIRGFALNRRLCVAPMMAWTDRHCRYLHRLASPHAVLFTEMVTSSAIMHGPADRLLRFHEEEHPVALQLGGSDARELAAAAERGARAGFDEINLNVGCPSPRVRQGRFGACLMREGSLVRDCIARMTDAIDVPVTVKCRLGVDEHDTQALLERFVSTVAEGGCRTFYVHARKALLNGLSPAENRTVPPLQYERVYALKARFSELEIIVNGGITRPDEVETHLAAVDGVMIGRAAYQQPMVLGEMEDTAFPSSGANSVRHSRASLGRDCSHRDPRLVMAGYRTYMAEELERGTRLADMTRHVLGLFAGLPGARRFRRILSDARRLKTNDLSLVDEALAALSLEPPETRAA